MRSTALTSILDISDWQASASDPACLPAERVDTIGVLPSWRKAGTEENVKKASVETVSESNAAARRAGRVEAIPKFACGGFQFSEPPELNLTFAVYEL